MENEFITALVALLISLIALVGTILQVLQQYLASAAGYSNCDEEVIGEWHKCKRRKFRWKELRFEVRFEAPVIFCCPPTNNKGPVKGADVWHIDGTPRSLSLTKTKLLSAEEQVEAITSATAKSIHTADNEQATWVKLLQELQRMERDSQAWAKGQFSANSPRTAVSQFVDHTLCAALQAKKRSWDSMPPNVKKPYGTTAMCHLIEMAAMLGIHWKEFDRSKDKYRAEGNGYVLTGTQVADLGIMFTFQISGKSRFEDNRLVPADEVKELAFGFVSTIFRGASDNRRLEFPTEEPTDLGMLQLGSLNEVAETLASFGCNTSASNCLRDGKKKHGHLFPLAFEILGMLGRTLHLPNSCFRVVPNPTVYHWDKKYFSMKKMLQEYKNKIGDDDLVVYDTEQVKRLKNMAAKVNKKLRPKRMEHNGLAMQTGINLELLDSLHECLDKCDKYLKDIATPKMVELVLREHCQEVLRMVNNEDEDEYTDEDGDEGGAGRERRRPRFDDLMTASREEKQEVLMDIYFAVLLPRVVQQATQVIRRAKTSALQVPPSQGHRRSPSADSSASGVSSAPPSGSPSPTPCAAMNESGPEIQVEGDDDPGPVRPSLRHQGTNINERQATEVWCTLVFRMLCWLQLHDFHKKDVQISTKSELLGSRLPVYIS